MTDTRARDALAAALGDAFEHMPVEFGLSLQGYGYDAADAILACPFTVPERRALAAAFLDADPEGVQEAVYRALLYVEQKEPPAMKPLALIRALEQDGYTIVNIAALRETP